MNYALLFLGYGVWAVMFLVSGGCDRADRANPLLLGLSPEVVPAGVESTVTIHGQHFYVEIVAELDTEEPPVVDTQFAVAIAGMQLPPEATAWIDDESLAVNVPANLTPGSHSVTVTTPGGRSVTVDEALTVAPLRLSIEDAAGGTGVGIGDVDILLGQTLQLYAVARYDGIFLEDVPVDWSVLDDLGTFDPVFGASTVFTATAAGASPISISHGAYGTASTGLLSATGCTLDDDCADACAASYQCIAGACVVAPPLPWWHGDFSQRRRLSFDNSGQTEPLTDFPVLVILDVSSFDYASAAPDGADLRFVDDDGNTELSYHIEAWNPSGQSFIWVRIPSIDAGSVNDHIWMYYGNPGAPEAQDESGTFDQNHVGVWHLNETEGPHVDSARGISCTWLGGGAGTQDAPGMIAGANDFDGAEDSADCGVDRIADSTYNTVTAWVNLPLQGDNHQEIVSLESVSAPYNGMAIYVRRNTGAIGKWLGSSYHYASTPHNRVTADEWNFIALRGYQHVTSGYIEVSRNGGVWETVFSGDTSNLRVDSGTPLILGKWPGPGPDASTNGRIDEIRISNIARSDDWIRAQYLSSRGTFVTDAGAETNCTP